MTDNEIKRALEICMGKRPLEDCEECPNYESESRCKVMLTEVALDLINRQQAEIERLQEIAKKMHTWIFLNSYDEEKAYAECGLTDEENIMLGYGGKIVFEKEEIAGDVK